MRIDIHAYIGHWPFRQLRGNTADDLLRRMDRYEVQDAWVGHIHGIFYKNAQAANEELIAALAPHGDRLIPFATINPTYAAWEQDLDRCVAMGVRGLRLYPQYHGYASGDTACLELVQAATERKLPVAFTTRLVDERQKSWLDTAARWSIADLAGLLERVPGGRYIVLHAHELPGDGPELEIFRKSHLLLDTLYASGVPVGFISAFPLATGIERLGPGKFAFGTGSPFRDYASPILRIQAFQAADQATLEGLWHANATRHLNWG